MLAEDAKLTMPPAPTWYRGREQVAIYLGGSPGWGDEPLAPVIPARANGQLAFGRYAWNDKRRPSPRAIDVLTLHGARDPGDHRLPHPRRLPRL